MRQKERAPGAALFRYSEAVTELMALLRAPVHQKVAEALLRLAKDSEWLETLRGVELVILAPQNRKHAVSGLESFGRLLARELKAEFVFGVLQKKSTHSQHGLSFGERMNGSCFVSCKSEFRVKGSSILLLDDVWTTGTTLDMSAYILRKAGAKNVERRALARQMMPGLNRKREEPEQKSDEVPIFLTHLFV
jgi:predicted amidophosphoribosyltransferase